MTDTIRIERPFTSRRVEDKGGRICQDQCGTERVVKTRAGDEQAAPLLTLDDPSGNGKSDRAVIIKSNVAKPARSL
jgi:hypothetical protein